MTHKRNDIIAEIKERLSLIHGLEVTSSRFYPITSLPHCTIVVIRDDVQHINLGKDLEHELQVDIELIVSGSIDVEDDLGDLCEKVEIKMVESPTLEDKAREVYLKSTEIEYSPDGENRHARATITYSIIYDTQYNNPSA